MQVKKLNQHQTPGIEEYNLVDFAARYQREKAIELITVWNERNSINLPVEELSKSVRSVYDSTYNYGCNDEVLKELCPFSDRRRCKQYRIYVSRTSRREAGREEDNEFQR